MYIPQKDWAKNRDAFVLGVLAPHKTHYVNAKSHFIANHRRIESVSTLTPCKIHPHGHALLSTLTPTTIPNAYRPLEGSK
jgi:hypothetical protein